MTIAQLEQTLSYAEFAQWLAFMKIEQEQVEKTDLYLAQIAYCVFTTSVPDQKVSFEQFLFSAQTKKEVQNISPQMQEKMYLAAFGIQI